MPAGHDLALFLPRKERPTRTWAITPSAGRTLPPWPARGNLEPAQCVSLAHYSPVLALPWIIAGAGLFCDMHEFDREALIRSFTPSPAKSRRPPWWTCRISVSAIRAGMDAACQSIRNGSRPRPPALGVILEGDAEIPGQGIEAVIGAMRGRENGQGTMGG